MAFGTVITSMTSNPRLRALIPMFCVAWTRLGFEVHVVIVGPCESCVQLLQVGQFCEKVTMQFMPMSNQTADSLPGLSRYMAASTFNSSLPVILSDVDLLPLPPMQTYVGQLLASARAAPKRVTVDFVYPQTVEFKARAGNTTEWSAAQIYKYSRLPRYRTCYLVGLPLAFAAIMKPGKLDVYSSSTMQRAYSKWPTVWGLDKARVQALQPDVSYDEILFGAVAMPHMLNILPPRNHSVHQMLGEFGCFSWNNPPPSAIDVHYSRRGSRSSEKHRYFSMQRKALSRCRTDLERW